MLYRLAIETGLRACELRSLKVENINYKANITFLSGAYTKNHQTARLPIKPDTVKLLQAHIKSHRLHDQLIHVPDKTSKMIKADLDDAQITHRDQDLGKLDFHSLRHTFGTLLAGVGAHPKTRSDQQTRACRLSKLYT